MFQRSKSGAVDVIRPEIPLNLTPCQAFADTMSHVTERGRPMVVLDMARVELIDSRGLEEIVDQFDQCIRFGGELKIAEPTQLVFDLLQVTGINERIEIFNSKNEAVASFLR